MKTKKIGTFFSSILRKIEWKKAILIIDGFGQIKDK